MYYKFVLDFAWRDDRFIFYMGTTCQWCFAVAVA